MTENRIGRYSPLPAATTPHRLVLADPVVFSGDEANDFVRSLDERLPGHAERLRRCDVTFARVFSPEPANDLLP